MFIDVTITYLEMTSLDQLVPGRPPPAPLQLAELGRGSLELLRSTYCRVGAPHHWITRPAWSEDQWAELLSRLDVHPWIFRVGGEVAGMVEFAEQSGGDVEIAVFGLVPEFVGMGFGGHALTLGTRLAWTRGQQGGPPARRVWLHTSSLDHPHALRNYRRRGFRPFRVEHKQREMPT